VSVSAKRAVTVERKLSTVTGLNSMSITSTKPSSNGPLRVGIGGPEALVRLQALSADRIMGVETGGCPHTAIREDASINLRAIETLRERHPDLDVILIESGGDNLAATFSPELADLSIYVISVCQGEDIPRKGGPAITRSDLLVINKTDLAPHVDADLESMRVDAQRARPNRPTVFTNLRDDDGSQALVEFLCEVGGICVEPGATA